jgi:uncharacterized membrane protein YjjP (DUF1212 family)
MAFKTVKRYPRSNVTNTVPEEDSTTPKALKNPLLTSVLVLMAGTFGLFIIANLATPEDFGNTFTYLITIPILVLVPGLCLVAAVVSLLIIKGTHPNNSVLARGLSAAGLILNVMCVGSFLITIYAIF